MKRKGLKPTLLLYTGVFISGLTMYLLAASNTEAAQVFFKVQATLSTPQIAPGSTLAITLAATNTGSKQTSAITSLTIHDPSGNQIFNQTWLKQNFYLNKTINLNVTYPIPSNAPVGKYTLDVELLNSDQTRTFYSNPAAASYTIITPVYKSTSKLMFGIGTEADGDLKTRLATEAPVRMLTSWYNGPNDLTWITGWHKDLVPQSYANGYALHLIIWTGDPEVSLTTPYGPACGRAYPLSSRFLGDMTSLAQTFAGNGPLYVTLFTEFQTYPCKDNQWVGSENYYKTLKDQYKAGLAIFHQYAPNSKVSLGWGGWQTRWDDPINGGGRSLFNYFADVMSASDFQSFQAMQSDSNVIDVLEMTKTLGAYGPVMLAHYKPDNASQTTFDADIQAMLNSNFITQLTAAGLFAWSFMDDVNMNAEENIYQFIKSQVITFSN